MYQFHSSQTSNSHINFDMLIRELSLLRELADSSTIVVEGKRDAEALRSLGIDAEFYFISGSLSSINQLAESLSEKGKEVIVLTDFDSKGKQLAARLIRELHGCGKKVKVNTEVRRNLMRAFNNVKIGEIEDLKSLIEKFKGDIYGKNRNRSNKIRDKGKAYSHRRS